MAKLLNWGFFQQRMVKYPVFTTLDVRREFEVAAGTAMLAVYRYRKQGFIERLRRGLYTFPGTYLPDPYLANHLYQPSYVSLEFALSFHGIIPETVYAITSVTPRATQTFQVRGKTFTFHRLKKGAFTGYRIVRQGGFTFAMADPEKAFVDLAYYRWRIGAPPLTRFRRAKIQPARAVNYARLFRLAKLTAIVSTSLR